MIDTLRLTAEDAAGLLERSEVSGDELAGAYLEAIDERDPELHAYLHVAGEARRRPDRAQGQHHHRRHPDHRRLAHPRGLRPRLRLDRRHARARTPGLPILGKTNMDEFAMGSSTENSAYGPTKNPWDPERVPGGSSGGSAAAVAGGLAPWALGSDTGGSIKQPASLCGLVGLRPTYGTVSRYGIVAFASSLDQVGPITKTVRDCARLYEVIAGRDPCDSTTVELPEPVEIPDGGGPQGHPDRHPQGAERRRGNRARRRRAGRRPSPSPRSSAPTWPETTLPRSVDYGLACYYLIAPAEASSNLARYDGVRYGYRAERTAATSPPSTSARAGRASAPSRSAAS